MKNFYFDFRYTAIGVASFIHGRRNEDFQFEAADVFSRITIDVKKWIKGIATGAQDSNCRGTSGGKSLTSLKQ